MTIANFKLMIESWLNRNTGSFTQNGVDNLLNAMNDARRMAMRDHDFELLRTGDCYISTHAGGADWSTGCFTTPALSVQQKMKRIDSIWQFSTMNVGASAYYVPTARIPFNTQGDLKRDLPVVDMQFLTINQPQPFVPIVYGYAVGTTLFVTGITSAATYKLYGIKWLDDLTGSESPDIFLTYFTDWFRTATVFCLNNYLKDSERFNIDVSSMSRAWSSVCQMDGTIANMGEQSNLD